MRVRRKSNGGATLFLTRREYTAMQEVIEEAFSRDILSPGATRRLGDWLSSFRAADKEHAAYLSRAGGVRANPIADALDEVYRRVNP